MGKRSDFQRIPRDYYKTPEKAVLPLVSHLPKGVKFSEPCAGDGQLVHFLLKNVEGSVVTHASDLLPQESPFGISITKEDAFWYEAGDEDYIITNPPWDRKILHELIIRFSDQKPTWLLFDADWAYTKQASYYMKRCSKIVAIGRVQWIPGSKTNGKDNSSWYLFDKNNEGPAEFYGINIDG